MAVLRQHEDGASYVLVETDDNDRATTYDLRPEGSQILMNVYGIKPGGQVDPDTVAKLVGLRLASARPAPEPKPDPLPVPRPRPQVEVKPDPEPVAPPPPPVVATPPPAPAPIPSPPSAPSRPARTEPTPMPPSVAPPRRSGAAGPLSRSSRERERERTESDRPAEPSSRPASAASRSHSTSVTATSGESKSGTGLPKTLRKTRGREVALQALYQVEQNPGLSTARVDLFLRRRLQEDTLCTFAKCLVEGVQAHRERIDALITDVAENWRLDRMAAIDRNILRLGAYEMLFDPSVPAKVAINEALELAKRYSTAQSSRFVNGILDRLLLSETARPADAPTADAEAAPAPDPEG